MNVTEHLVRTHSLTTLMVTHSMEQAVRFGDRTIMMHRGLIVAEGVYSMDGQILDLKRAVETKKRHDMLLMVDEAHSFGIVGKTGRGVCEQAGMPVDRRQPNACWSTAGKSVTMLHTASPR